MTWATLVLDNVDLVSVVFTFCRKDEYLFIGTVNRAFHHSARGHRETHEARCFETVSRLQDSEIYSHVPSTVQRGIAMCGSVEVIRHALLIGLVDNVNCALEDAIRCNDHVLVDALQDEFHRTKVGPACLVAAVESGSVEMVRKFCADGVLDPRAPNFGLEDNYFHPFDERAKRMICRHWRTYVGDYLIDTAKRCGHFDVLKWLHAHNIPPNDSLEDPENIGEAAMHGNREMVEWMLGAGYKPSACEIPYASHSNGVAYLDWLVDKGCMIDPDSLDFCSSADADVITWLRNKGFAI